MPYHNIERQDIIVFRYPVHPSMYFVKRVIGLPGDRIRLVNKRVYRRMPLPINRALRGLQQAF